MADSETPQDKSSEEEEYSSSEEEEEDSSSSYDDDDIELDHGNILQVARAMLIPGGGMPPNAPAVPQDNRSPAEKWKDYLTGIQTRKTKILKLTDMQLQQEQWPFLNSTNDDDDEEENWVWINELVTAVSEAAAVAPMADTNNGGGSLTHAMIGAQMLSLLGVQGQKDLFRAVASHDTLSFFLIKGSDDSSDKKSSTTALQMDAVTEALGNQSTPGLSQMQLEGIQFRSVEHVQQWSDVLAKKQKSLRQVNLLGIDPLVAAPIGWLDPILKALSLASPEDSSPLDELRLVCSDTCNSPSITSDALEEMLRHKKKWWRLGLDGLGLTDDHVQVLTSMFSRDDTCKAGDLLSLLNNPAITANAFRHLFEHCFFWKQRMGLIKVDNKEWEAQFDLVRSMNNLHNRLEYVLVEKEDESNNRGKASSNKKYKARFVSRGDWIDWLVKLGTGLPWEDDMHRLNYLWFTLLEKPDFIYSAGQDKSA